MEFKNPEDTVFDDFYKTFPELTTTQIRTILGTFLFSGEDVFKKIKVLSGGDVQDFNYVKYLRKVQICCYLTNQPIIWIL